MEFFDTHSHYNDEKFDTDRNKIIEDTYQNGITKFTCCGYNIESSQKAFLLAKQYEYIYAICGISPQEAPKQIEEIPSMVKQIEQILKTDEKKKVVAVGEIGLDYYWGKENQEIQKKLWKEQIQLANQFKLPIVIHTRDAIMDTLQILKQQEVTQKGIIHCCSFNRELVKEALKLGYYISFAGTITFKNAKNAEEIVNMVPLEKLLIETDSPYLAPEPKRGTRNNSMNVKYIAEKIAVFRKMQLEEIASITYENAKRIFQIQ